LASNASSLATPDHTHRIGPNAVLRVAEALSALEGEVVRRRVFDHPSLAAYRDKLPEDMVPEAHVAALQAALYDALPLARARAVNREAGRLTGDYLLRRRIPRPLQPLLRHLPARYASRLLLKGIGRHTWTFAGSAKVEFAFGPPVRISLYGCPLCRNLSSAEPVCDYYAATFERIYRDLVAARGRAREVACQARGAPACVFEIRW
jgi:divinyl protochlorophyllide a 8-vinyl-reductase